jgi:hypothetical protein
MWARVSNRVREFSASAMDRAYLQLVLLPSGRLPQALKE